MYPPEQVITPRIFWFIMALLAFTICVGGCATYEPPSGASLTLARSGVDHYTCYQYRSLNGDRSRHVDTARITIHYDERLVFFSSYHEQFVFRIIDDYQDGATYVVKLESQVYPHYYKYLQIWDGGILYQPNHGCLIKLYYDDRNDN